MAVAVQFDRDDLPVARPPIGQHVETAGQPVAAMDEQQRRAAAPAALPVQVGPADRDVPALHAHGPSLDLASTRNGSLRGTRTLSRQVREERVVLT